MTETERIDKVIQGFSRLSEEKQTYILGIIQALVYVNDEQVNAARSELPVSLEGSGEEYPEE